MAQKPTKSEDRVVKVICDEFNVWFAIRYIDLPPSVQLMRARRGLFEAFAAGVAVGAVLAASGK
jgi:hypothetical protein